MKYELALQIKLVAVRLSKNTTNNIQHTTQHTTKMSRHWLRQYTTYDIDAKKPFKPYRMTKNSFKIFALP